MFIWQHCHRSADVGSTRVCKQCSRQHTKMEVNGFRSHPAHAWRLHLLASELSSCVAFWPLRHPHQASWTPTSWQKARLEASLPVSLQLLPPNPQKVPTCLHRRSEGWTHAALFFTFLYNFA